MKLLSILILSFVLAGCGMSIEEYNARVKYCNDNNATAEAGGQGLTFGPLKVLCKKDGVTFDSEEAK